MRIEAGSAWDASASARDACGDAEDLVGRGSPIDVMLVSNIPEEPYLALRHEHSHTQSMYGRVTEPFVVEASSSVQPVEVSFIRFAAEEVQIPNLKVGKELAVIVVSAIM